MSWLDWFAFMGISGCLLLNCLPLLLECLSGLALVLTSKTRGLLRVVLWRGDLLTLTLTLCHLTLRLLARCQLARLLIILGLEAVLTECWLLMGREGLACRGQCSVVGLGRARAWDWVALLLTRLLCKHLVTTRLVLVQDLALLLLLLLLSILLGRLLLAELWLRLSRLLGGLARCLQKQESFV